MGKRCEICGKPSGRYFLCKNCYQKGEQNDDLPWDNLEKDDATGECLICGADSGEYLFCRKCYNKYKNKVITLQCRNCQDFKILDSRYDNQYRCIDGHIVKSKAERDIDNFLYRHRIMHCYEKPISIDGNEENDIHPDFYLPDMDAYIEHWGMDGDYEYDKIKKYKLNIYKKLRITLICTYEKTDSVDIENALIRKLRNFKKHTINFLINDPPPDDDLPF